MKKETSTKLTEKLKIQALKELESAQDLDVLQDWRINYLGRKGKITQILRGLSALSPADRRQTGAIANETRKILESSLDAKEKNIRQTLLLSQIEQEQIDVTLPGLPSPTGKLHIITQTVREICAVFSSMGFEIAEGPEVELDRYNFEMLNIPKEHPARDMWNTLWVDSQNNVENESMLLRTHTSPMQARIMEKKTPPIRVVVPGKCYRYEATDATHEWHFHQVEGLVIDKGITFANLKSTLYEFVKIMFGQERKIRFRCDYFPFVEPGVDMSIDCFKCNGTGCRVCSETGWIEIMGAGIVHPNVLQSVGYDPECISGFAFGMGPERIAMLKYGIEDIRHFYSNNLRFLNQF